MCFFLTLALSVCFFCSIIQLYLLTKLQPEAAELQEKTPTYCDNFRNKILQLWQPLSPGKLLVSLNSCTPSGYYSRLNLSYYGPTC